MYASWGPEKLGYGNTIRRTSVFMFMVGFSFMVSRLNGAISGSINYKMAARGHLRIFEWPSPQRVIQFTSCLVLRQVFRVGVFAQVYSTHDANGNQKDLIINYNKQAPADRYALTNNSQIIIIVVMTKTFNFSFQPTVLTVALMLQCCVCLSSVCLSVTLCIVAKRCILEQKLLLRAYMKSYMSNRLVPK